LNAKPQPVPVDERVRRSKEAVLAATFALLGEAGLGGVSVDEVSRRSGVAKTTIYRHWPTRSALLLEACSKMTERPPVPATGSLKGDLTALAEMVAERLSDRWSSVLPSVVDAAERDAELARLHAQLHADMMSAFRAVIARAQEAGDLAKGVAATDLIGAIVGPLFYRRWFSREPLSKPVARAIVDRALKGL
jgi:AcrR family transcriptional regulator